jgi:uncharacterized membrane protein
MDSIVFFFGRFHPLIVHLPVALLPLAALFFGLSKIKKFKSLESSVIPLLIAGTLSAVFAVMSGLMIAESGDYDVDLLNRHKWFGISSTVVGCGALFIKSRKLEFVVLSLLLILVSLTGHWGGMLTHGENWFSMTPPAQKKDVLQKLKATSIDSTSQAMLYADLVAPLLDAKCVSCHNAQKQKGELRLDSETEIQKGGKHGLIVDVTNPEKSELLLRIQKTIEEKGHMPPRQEAQLENLEIELLKWWILAGAPFDKTVAQAKPPMLLTKLWQAKPIESLADWLPETQPQPVEQGSIDSLNAVGIKVVPIAQASNYVMISIAGERAIPANAWSRLIDLRNNIVDADLSYATLTPETIKTIGMLTQLRRLKLNYTNITDADLPQLKTCAALRSLHVIGTNITKDAALAIQSLPQLKKVFVFGTPLAKSTALATLPQADSGNLTLPRLVTDTLVYTSKKKGFYE